LLITHGSSTSISHRWAAAIRQYRKALLVDLVDGDEVLAELHEISERP
jgi:hypothetical protein